MIPGLRELLNSEATSLVSFDLNIIGLSAPDSSNTLTVRV